MKIPLWWYNLRQYELINLKMLGTRLQYWMKETKLYIWIWYQIMIIVTKGYKEILVIKIVLGGSHLRYQSVLR